MGIVQIIVYALACLFSLFDGLRYLSVAKSLKIYHQCTLRYALHITAFEFSRISHEIFEALVTVAVANRICGLPAGKTKTC